MKKRRSRKRKKINSVTSNKYLIIEVGERERVVVYNPEKCVSVSEINRIQQSAQTMKQEIKNMYYKRNTPINNAKKRTMVDLIKLFLTE